MLSRRFGNSNGRLGFGAIHFGNSFGGGGAGGKERPKRGSFVLAGMLNRFTGSDGTWSGNGIPLEIAAAFRSLGSLIIDGGIATGGGTV